MVRLKKNVLCILAINFTLLIFLKSFFPVKITSKELADRTKSSKLQWPLEASEKKTIKKVILMIIDALRSDFAFGEYNFFPNVLALMKKGHGIHFRAEMQPPTVTLPRIKVNHITRLCRIYI